MFESLLWYIFAGKRGRLSKADLDTGWSKDDERQCSLCQKYGDLKPNVSNYAFKIENTAFLIPNLETELLINTMLSTLMITEGGSQSLLWCCFIGSRQVAVPRPE